MQKFSFEELPLKGAYLIKTFESDDIRGNFVKDYSKEIFKQNGIEYDLAETFYTKSHKGVMRALHFQEINQQPKLVRCISGKVFDVIVDLRPKSPTFKKWMGFYLTDDANEELLIPAHFAHGYLVLKDSIVSYKCSTPFDGPNDSGIMYNDSDIDVRWPFEEIGGEQNLILAEKDKNLQSFKEYFLKGCL